MESFWSKAKNMNIALLCGPKSLEDSLYFNELPFKSLSSGFVFKKLKEMGLNVRVVLNTSSNLEKKLAWADVVFINMHGEFGEDGSVQGLLAYLKKPFTGSNIYASSIGVDKLRFKRLVSILGLKTPKWSYLSFDSYKSFSSSIKKVGLPVIAKILNGGSSIGMHVIGSSEDMKPIYKKIKYGSYKKEKYFVEEFVIGRNFTIGVLDLPTQTITLPLLEIKTRTKSFYSQDLKIKSQKGENVVDYIVPAQVSPSIEKAAMRNSLEIFRKIEFSGFGRIDFMLRRSTLYFLEINTIPGLQENSNFLMCAKEAGISVEFVLLALIYKAIHASNSRLLSNYD